MTHIAESLHWYDRHGRPAYSVKAKAGHDRPTTLADARKLGLVPSVTNIIRCAAAPGLEIWKQQQVLLAALTLQRRDGESEDAYLTRIMQNSKEQARRAADRGTAIHAAIQGYLQNEKPDPAFTAHVHGALAAIDEALFPEWDSAIAESSFAHPLGFGGKVDLICTDPWLVVDFKTKEFGPEDDLKTWDEQAMQLAAYREGQRPPSIPQSERIRGAIVYVSTTHPGLARVIELPEEDLAKGWTMFYSLLHYWQAKNVYRASFSNEMEAA